MLRDSPCSGGADTGDDTEDATGIDPVANASEESKEMLETFYEALPGIAIAAVVILIAYIVVRILRRVLQPRLSARRTESFGRVMTKLFSWAVMIVGLLIAAILIFPGVDPVSIIGGLGIFSIAIGFAFQDILSNLLAGMLLLFRQPFEAGDQIEVSEVRGTVQGITIRETQIKTFDGEKLIIPNAEVYQNIIRVQTAYGPKRIALMIGLEDWEDLDRAADIILAATRDVEGVEKDPAPEALFFEFGESTTNLDLRFWTESQQHGVRQVTDRVVRSVGKALKENNIPMPSPVRELDARRSLAMVTDPDGDWNDLESPGAV